MSSISTLPSAAAQRHIGSTDKVPSAMLQAEAEVCVDCGSVHMEGGPAPDHLEECAACGGNLADVELDDLVGL